MGPWIAAIVLAIMVGIASSFAVGIEQGAARTHAEYAAAIKAKNGEIDALAAEVKEWKDKRQEVRTEIVRELVPLETVTEVVKRVPVRTPCDLDPETIKKLNLIR